MATLLRSANFKAPPPSLSNNPHLKPLKTSSCCISFRNKSTFTRNCSSLSHNSLLKYSNKHTFLVFSSSPSGEATETEPDTVPQQQEEEALQDNDGGVAVENAEEALNDDDKPDTEETPSSPVITALQLYKEALSNNEESKVAELEAFFKSIEDEKDGLESKLASISEDLSVERERVLRISADFDNFRKRTERERLSLKTNAQGEVVENFLSVLDNFERAKSQIKISTEGEEKINNSYQSIYKQFTEILSSIGVVPVETVGKEFDPLLHEAIMREESTEYEEGIVLEEYRKGFKLGDRLLRPSMVKVSAGPGPEKPQNTEPSVEEEGTSEATEEAGGEGDAKED